MTAGEITLADVQGARDRIASHLPPTPLRRAFCTGNGEVFLKLECWQPTGSFKVRGAMNTLLSLTAAEKAAGVVAASAGNHALGVAFAAAALGGAVDATLFVPESAPLTKVDKLRTYPVRIEQGGRTYEEAYARARDHAQESGATYIHAFDDPRTAAGQGTVALEILDALPRVDTLLVPVGGGGLMAGMAVALKALRPEVRVVGVQPAASPALSGSLRAGHALYEFDAAPTLADGLAGGIGDLVFRYRALIDDVVEVTEDEIGEAMIALLSHDQVVTEGAGAVGVAALRTGRVALSTGGPVAVVVTGGNVDAAVLARLLPVHLERATRRR